VTVKFVTVSLLALCFTTLPTTAKTPDEIQAGGVLRDVQMQGLLGPSIKLSVLRGKPLVINVWASWCGPCREEMASLERLSRRFWGGQFNVIGISTDDYKDRAEAFLRKSGVTFSNYIDQRLALENMLGADRLPLTLLVDSQGRVLAKFYGAKDWDSPESLALIARYLRIKL
jgi:thiol-disulfide isomerase/thioredoxin